MQNSSTKPSEHGTNILKSKDLLLISPHLEVFIKDQAMQIRPYFHDIFVLMPFPHFSKIAILPCVGRYFSFLGLPEKSRSKPELNFKLISPNYFTLPIEFMRKRNCYIATKSCVKSLWRSSANFNLIHAHFIENGFIGATLKSLYTVQLVVTAHGGDVYDLPFRDKWYRNLTKFVLTEADQVITVSNFNAEKLLLLGVSPNKLHVIPNGYNEKLFTPIPMLEAREKLSLPFNKKVLLTVGNLVEVKGHSYLIDAMSYVLKQRTDVILVIVGSGYLKETLQKKARNSSLKEKILFVGGKNHEEVPIWMNACDVFVLPSLKESFGTVINEAMSCGKPVVATNTGGIPEHMRGDVGILVEPANPKSLSDGLLEALDRKWDAKGIRNYVEQYSWSKILERILNVYCKALEN